MIEKYKNQYPVNKMCEILDISRSGYYDWRSRGKSDREKANEKLLLEIKRVYRESLLRYGSPRITEQVKERLYS